MSEQRGLKFFKGFTLAEVLISLAIIGIVATLTIPGVITRYKERALITKLKKAQSIFAQAYNMALAENGAVETWDLNYYTEEGKVDRVIISEIFAKKIIPYLKLSKDCGYEDGCFITDKKYKRMDGNDYFSFGGETRVRYMVMLETGEGVAFLYEGNSTTSFAGDEEVIASIYYDVNGMQEPNTFGKDLFQFVIAKDSIYPAGSPWTNKSQILPYCYGAGLTCQAWIFQFDNMDYLHCKDLSWNNKHKCGN